MNSYVSITQIQQLSTHSQSCSSFVLLYSPNLNYIEGNSLTSYHSIHEHFSTYHL